MWLESYADATHCTLREVALDGSARAGPRPVPCSTELVDSGSGAFVVEGTSVVDPDTGETVLDAGYLWAVAGGVAITMDSYHPGPVTLTDLRSREQLPRPRRPGRRLRLGAAGSHSTSYSDFVVWPSS